MKTIRTASRWKVRCGIGLGANQRAAQRPTQASGATDLAPADGKKRADDAE